MKKNAEKSYLTKREQQVMELIFKHERLTANDLVNLMPGGPSKDRKSVV